MSRRGNLSGPVALAAIATLAAMLPGCVAGSARTEEEVLVAVTTSTQDTGLLDALVPAFERRTGLSVKPIAVGSGQALELARRGAVDVVLAHSPAAERRLMASGLAQRRRRVMHNFFVLVGPASDPAGVAGLPVVEALRRIARRRALFVSRGDDSGTHVFERRLWRRAGIRPAAPWHQETGQGQSATLQVAAERGGYALTDSGTLLTSGADDDLPLVVGRGARLRNPYHVIAMTRRAGRRVNAVGGRAFADWLVSEEAQHIIGRFGRERFGRPLFIPVADRARSGNLAVSN